MCDGSAHSSGCVVNGYGCLLSYYYYKLVDIRVVLCASVPSLIVRNANTTKLKLLLPEAFCCCLQTCKCGFDVRVVLCTSVYTKSHSQECLHNQVIGINISNA